MQTHYKDSIEYYAEKLFEKNMKLNNVITTIDYFNKFNIKYRLCNKDNGHFVLYIENEEVIAYWSNTGRCYIIGTRYSYDIGVKNCVAIYLNKLIDLNSKGD